MTITAPVTGTPAPTPETPTISTEPTKAPEASKKDDWSEKLELLSRQTQKAYRERMAAVEERKKVQEMMNEINKFKSARENAKKNPIDYLAEGGLDYDTVTQYMLNGGKQTATDEIAAVKEEIKRLREEQTTKEKKQQEESLRAQRVAETQALDSFKEEIGEFMKANEATYELSAQRDAVDDIFSTISEAYALNIREWQRTGRQGPEPKPMPIKEAADVVEAFYEKEVQRLTETKKWQARSQPKPDEQTQKKEPSKTLTNNMASTAASVLPAKNDHDRMARAMAKLNG